MLRQRVRRQARCNALDAIGVVRYGNERTATIVKPVSKFFATIG